MNKKQAGIFITILGIIALVFGLVMFSNRRTYIKTTAVITKIEYTYDTTNDENNYDVYVEYTVDGKKYNELFGYYKDGFEVGQEVEIMYNPNDVTKIQTAEIGFPRYLVIIGPVLMVLGVVLFIKK